MEQFVLAHLLHLLGDNFNSNSNQNLQHNFSLQEKCTINCVKESLKHLLQLVCIPFFTFTVVAFFYSKI